MDELRGSNIENAVAKCSEGHRRMANIRCIGERHLQDCDVVDDRCRYSGDEEEDG